jgi:hypothetical protein
MSGGNIANNTAHHRVYDNTFTDGAATVNITGGSMQR